LAKAGQRTLAAEGVNFPSDGGANNHGGEHRDGDGHRMFDIRECGTVAAEFGATVTAAIAVKCMPQIASVSSPPPAA
jgi:hypothetical protein